MRRLFLYCLLSTAIPLNNNLLIFLIFWVDSFITLTKILNSFRISYSEDEEGDVKIDKDARLIKELELTQSCLMVNPKVSIPDVFILFPLFWVRWEKKVV